MYITIRSIKKTLGKYVEMADLYLGLPLFIIFLILFSCTDFKLLSIIFFTIGAFLLIPINFSKKNRIYKIILLLIRYTFKIKRYYFFNEELQENKLKILSKYFKQY